MQANYSCMNFIPNKYIKNKIDAKLLLTDTDSLVYEIKSKDVYEDFYEDKKLFDLSDYPLYSKFFDLVNKKVVGKMKDEFKGKIISEFVGLKSKMYSLITVDDEELTKAKGVNKKIRHKEFSDVLFKVNCIELELVMFVKFHSLDLMIKDIY